MAGRKKSQHRGLARVLSIYHLPGAAAGYDEWVGLELNADDMELRATWFEFLAFTYASRPDVPLPSDWFAAVAAGEREAAEMEYRWNSRRGP